MRGVARQVHASNPVVRHDPMAETEQRGPVEIADLRSRRREKCGARISACPIS